MRRAGDAVDLAHQNRTPRHRRLEHGGHGAHAMANGGRLFGFAADQKARGYRPDAPPAGERSPPDRRTARPSWMHLRSRRAIMKRVAGQDRDRPAVQPGEAGDDRAAPFFPDLKKRIAVDHRFDDRPHFVDAARVAGNGADQPILAAVAVVFCRITRRQIVDRGRQVGQKPAGRGKSLGFAGDLVIDGAVRA